jgi:hypothetical protein
MRDLSPEAFERRKTRAIERGWTSTQLGVVWWVGDAGGNYSWLGDTEFEAWWELLMDAELYDELTEVLGL